MQFILFLVLLILIAVFFPSLFIIPAMFLSMLIDHAVPIVLGIAAIFLFMVIHAFIKSSR